jgi:hypothetical protein
MVVIATLVAGGAVVSAAGPTGGGAGGGMGGGGMGVRPPFFFRGGGGSYAAFGANAATVGESYARGIGELIRATGAVNLDLSEAALNLTEAESRQLKNDVDFVNTYFEVRRLSKQLRAQERGPRPSMEDLIRFAQLGKPQRLSPGDIDAASGQIFWPIILRAQVFASNRIKLETYFGERGQPSGLTPESYLRLDQTARAMVEELRRYVADFPPGDYLHAKHFIESLGYEAHFPVGQPVTTAAASNNVVPADQVR